MRRVAWMLGGMIVAGLLLSAGPVWGRTWYRAAGLRRQNIGRIP